MSGLQAAALFVMFVAGMVVGLMAGLGAWWAA